jgi:phytanoyl-CoA hydroxylase
MDTPATSVVFSEDDGIAVAEQAADLYQSNAQVQHRESLDVISEQDITFFHEQGYLVIDRVFSKAQIEAARAGINDLIEGADPSFRGVQLEPGISKEYAAGLSPQKRQLAVRKLMGFANYDARLKAMADDAGILDLLQRLMADEPVLFQEMALLKGPGGREKPWHQDCAYFDMPLGTSVIGVWIALDEANQENGCLHIMPGSHRDGPVNHFKVRDWQICDTEVQKERAVAVPIAAGGCLLWHGMTHHGSPPNLSTQRRRALQFHYKPAQCGASSTEERLQLFGGEVRGAQC